MAGTRPDATTSAANHEASESQKRQLKRKLHDLKGLDVELGALLNLARKHAGSHIDSATLVVPQLCSLAARVRHERPAGLPANSTSPSWLPYPDKRTDYPQAALHMGSLRAPPPFMTVAEGSRGLDATIHCTAPATGVIYTTNQSVPGRDNKATRYMAIEAKPLVLPLGRGAGEAHHVHVRALGPGLQPSDLVSVSAPKVPHSSAAGPAAAPSMSHATASTTLGETTNAGEQLLKRLKQSDKIRDFLEGMT